LPGTPHIFNTQAFLGFHLRGHFSGNKSFDWKQRHSISRNLGKLPYENSRNPIKLEVYRLLTCWTLVHLLINQTISISPLVKLRNNCTIFKQFHSCLILCIVQSKWCFRMPQLDNRWEGRCASLALQASCGLRCRNNEHANAGMRGCLFSSGLIGVAMAASRQTLSLKIVANLVERCCKPRRFVICPCKNGLIGVELQYSCCLPGKPHSLAN